MNNRTTLYEKWFKDEQGNIALSAPPNLPLMSSVIFALLALLPLPYVRTVFVIIAIGSFFTWSWLEIFDGVNYFRRTLGLVAMVALIVGISMSGIVQI